METYNLANRPDLATFRKVDTETITAAFISEPFEVETVNGPETISPDTRDDWEDGYVIAYPADGNKPYALSPKFVRENYVELTEVVAPAEGDKDDDDDDEETAS